MSNAYKTTVVQVSRSQEAIRSMLYKFGARGVQFTEDFETNEVNVRFGKMYGQQVRTVSVSMKVPEPPKLKKVQRRSKSHDERREQMRRATYRALHDWLKAQFVAIEFGLLTFEDVFLSHFEWMLDGQRMTIGELVKPRLELAGPLLSAPKETPQTDVIDGEISE